MADEGPPDHLLGEAEAVFRDDMVAETHEPTYAVAALQACVASL